MAAAVTQARINQITNECCDVIEDMLGELGVSYTRSNRRIFGPCPVHGGDNPMAWQLYPEGDMVRGYWRCYTRGCEKTYKKTLLGFVRGVLTLQSGKPVAWTDALAWMAKFLGYASVDKVPIPDAATLERQRQNNIMRRLSVARNDTVGKTWDPTQYRKAVQIPSPYYLSRGYSGGILKKYDVGDASRTNRSVVPVFNLDKTAIVGMIGRTHEPRCSTCNYYHAPTSPCPKTIAEQIGGNKWKNSPGFEAREYLYNLWYARPHIMASNTVVIVEGPGDVWRLEEAGIHNAVAIFGTDITDEQRSLLESSWSMNAVVLTDSDEAGRQAAEVLKKNWSVHTDCISQPSQQKTRGICIRMTSQKTSCRCSTN